jgi:hypothetical protein
MIGYWNSTGLSGEEIVAKQQKVIDDQLALFYNEEVDQGENPKNALSKVCDSAHGCIISYNFFENNHRF